MLKEMPKTRWVLSPGRYGTEGELLQLVGGRIGVGGARWNALAAKGAPKNEHYLSYMLLPGFKEAEQKSYHESMEVARTWVEHHFREWLVAVGILKLEPETSDDTVDHSHPSILPPLSEASPAAPRKTFKAFRKEQPPAPSAKPKLQRR